MLKLIQTERLIIRNLEFKDVDALYDYRHLSSVKKYQSWDNFTVSMARRLVEKNIVNRFDGYRGTANYAVELNGKLIGDIFVAANADTINAVSIGYTFHPDYQGYGYAREAVKAMIDYIFEFYNKDTIFAYVKEGNIKSMRLLIALGFELFDYDEIYADYGFKYLK